MLDGRSSNEVLPAVYLQNANKRNKDVNVSDVMRGKEAWL